MLLRWRALHQLYVRCRERGVSDLVHDLRSVRGVGFLEFALEVGSAGGDYDALCLSSELLHGSLMVERCLFIHDVCSMDLYPFNVVEAGVEVADLLVHLVQLDTEVGGEFLE